MKNKRFIIAIAVFLVIASFSGWFIYRDLKHTKEVGLPSGSPTSNSETPAAASNPSLNAEEIKKQMPDLGKEIIVKEVLSEETKNKTITDIKFIIADLKNNFDKLDAWLNLGLLRKVLGDYKGVEEAWQFAAIIRPNDPVAFHNLGDLYAQNLIDFPKAEENYKKAIEKDAGHQPFFYIKLYEFYRYYYKKPDLAEKTLLDALKTNPDNAYLKSLLEEL